MIQREYSKDSKNAYQILKTIIQADKSTIFRYLSTTDGISSWFPQLSIDAKENKGFVFFDMGDDTFEKMSLLDFKTDENIAFEWASGKVEFQLKETEEGTQLILKETLPLDFSAIPQDFTGWFVQMTNIKSVLETNSVADLNKTEIQKVREQIKQELFNK